MTDYDPLYHSFLLLAGKCDGARTEDGMGFSKLDTDFGHSLASKPWEVWTPRMKYVGWKFLRKYRNQLARYGIDYDAIPVPQVVSLEPKRVIELSPRGAKYRIKLEKGDPNFYLILNAVKEIPDRKWNPDDLVWEIPQAPESVDKLIVFGALYKFEMAPGVREKLNEGVKKISASTNNAEMMIAQSLALEPPVPMKPLKGWKTPLNASQIQDCYYSMVLAGGRNIIGNVMGKGKTRAAVLCVEWAEQHKDKFPKGGYPALFVVPNYVLLNWPEEIEASTDRKVTLLRGRTPERISKDVECAVINYNNVHYWKDRIKEWGPVAIICDESHNLKESRTQWTKAVKDIAVSGDIPIRLLLSGTLATNRPKELVSQFEILGRLKADWKSSWAFLKRYTNPFHNGYGWDFNGSANTVELNQKMRAKHYRRLPKDKAIVVTPAAIVTELDNQQEYIRARDDIVRYWREKAVADQEFLESIQDLSEEEKSKAKRVRWASAEAAAMRAEVLVRINAVRQVTGLGKVNAVINWVKNFLEEDEGKIIVFAYHQAVQKKLLEAFPQAARIIKDDPIEARKANERRFQTDPECRVIINSLRVGSMGITLTEAYHVAFAEFDWGPIPHLQGEGRAFGRLNDPHGGTAWYFVAPSAADKYMATMVDKKRKVTDEVNEGEHEIIDTEVNGEKVDGSMIFDLVKAMIEEDAA